MATRIYLPSPGYSPAPISPAFDAGWETTDTAGRRRCSTIKGASPMATSTVNMKNVVDADTLVTQYVFGPLKAQTISGTIKGQIQGRHDSGLLDTRAQLLVKVVSADGGTVRGTLLPMDTGALSSEFVAVLRNRMFPRGGAQALTNVAAQKGDWIVLEVGVRQHGTYTLHPAHREPALRRGRGQRPGRRRKRRRRRRAMVRIQHGYRAPCRRRRDADGGRVMAGGSPFVSLGGAGTLMPGLPAALPDPEVVALNDEIDALAARWSAAAEPPQPVARRRAAAGTRQWRGAALGTILLP